jgi:hypothetical protein
VGKICLEGSSVAGLKRATNLAFMDLAAAPDTWEDVKLRVS